MTDRAQSRAILTWADVGTALDLLIDLSQQAIDLADRDLSLQGWDSAERIDRLERALVDRRVAVRILLAEMQHLEQHLARLTTLVRRRSRQLVIVESSQPEALVQSMVVVDKQHGLVRPDPTRSQGRFWQKDPANSKAYEEFFKQAWRLGGRQFFPELHGL